jgi:hypothetical protein
MNSTNTKADPVIREAYFKWRKEHPYYKANVQSFFAGWNAAQAHQQQRVKAVLAKAFKDL